MYLLTNRKVYKSLSSTFLKTVKKQEAEVAKKLQEGNENDHSRHEDYILSYIEDPLKTQVYCHMYKSVFLLILETEVLKTPKLLWN